MKKLVLAGVVAVLASTVFLQYRAYAQLERESAFQRRYRNEVRAGERDFCNAWKKARKIQREEICTSIGLVKSCETCIDLGWEE